jgi:hypothetical protein
MPPTSSRDREPSSVLEARAVTRSIRAQKAFVGEMTLEDIASMPDNSRKEDWMRGKHETTDVE